VDGPSVCCYLGNGRTVRIGAHHGYSGYATAGTTPLLNRPCDTRATEHSPAYPARLFSDPRASLVSPALRASYALVGSQLQPGQHGPLTGIHVILSNGAGDTERQHREAQILQTGLFYSAARFRLIEGSPTPPNGSRYSRPTTPPPPRLPRAASHTLPAPQTHPQLSESFRLAGAPRAVGFSSPSITLNRAAAHVIGGRLAGR
jgi:hypothetical protein